MVATETFSSPRAELLSFGECPLISMPSSELTKKKKEVPQKRGRGRPKGMVGSQASPKDVPILAKSKTIKKSVGARVGAATQSIKAAGKLMLLGSPKKVKKTGLKIG